MLVLVFASKCPTQIKRTATNFSGKHLERRKILQITFEQIPGANNSLASAAQVAFAKKLSRPCLIEKRVGKNLGAFQSARDSRRAAGQREILRFFDSKRS